MTERPTHARGYTAGVGNNSNDDDDTIRYDIVSYRIGTVGADAVAYARIYVHNQKNDTESLSCAEKPV